MEYAPEDLKRLHSELVTILKEIIRVCEILDIPYFIQGGTAIGAYFDQGIVPWDDDIDLGMTRDHYNRFLKEAPAVLAKGYFLQCFDTEPDTPFYFAKVRKDGTLFVEKPHMNLDIHHGIFVDIFPFDNVPDNPRVERIHRRIVQFCEGAFKKSLLKESIREGLHGLPEGLADWWTEVRFKMVNILPRRFYYNRLVRVQSAFNKKDCKYVSIVKMPLDQIEKATILDPADMPFEGVMVKAPSHIERYLYHHYPKLQPTLPKELQVTHRPEILSFETGDIHQIIH